VTVKFRPRLPDRFLNLILSVLCPFVLLFETGTAVAAGMQQVYVTASFLDTRELFIEDLQADEVRILENGTPRKIEFVARDQIPVVYGLLFDRSVFANDSSRQRTLPGSAPPASQVKDMAFSLIDKYLRQQTLWVASYGLQFHLELDSTTDGFRAKEVISQIGAGRRTEEAFAYAGLYSAVQKMNQCHEKRRVIILFLDALDLESAGKVPQLKNLLSISNVELVIISFASRLFAGSGIPPAANRGALVALAQATAGDAYFSADSGGYFEDLTRRIHNHIRTFYTFGFESNYQPDRKTPLLIHCTRPGSRAKHHPNIPVFPAP
jgi:hypothetical protein